MTCASFLNMCLFVVGSKWNSVAWKERKVVDLKEEEVRKLLQSLCYIIDTLVFA